MSVHKASWGLREGVFLSAVYSYPANINQALPTQQALQKFLVCFRTWTDIQEAREMITSLGRWWYIWVHSELLFEDSRSSEVRTRDSCVLFLTLSFSQSR